MITQEEILKALENLDGFDVHPIDNAWYSEKTILGAFGGDKEKVAALPTVSVVRVETPGGGMLELHPVQDNLVRILCYCCFGGDFQKGIFPLDSLRDAVVSLREHNCPPWPG